MNVGNHYAWLFFLQGKKIVCLADYCDIVRCEVIAGHRKPQFWDVALCKEHELQQRRLKCTVSSLYTVTLALKGWISHFGRYTLLIPRVQYVYSSRKFNVLTFNPIIKHTVGFVSETHNRKFVLAKFAIPFTVDFSASFEYLCEGSMAIINISIISLLITLAPDVVRIKCRTCCLFFILANKFAWQHTIHVCIKCNVNQLAHSNLMA